MEKCHPQKIAEKLNISSNDAKQASKDLMTLGAFIDITSD